MEQQRADAAAEEIAKLRKQLEEMQRSLDTGNKGETAVKLLMDETMEKREFEIYFQPKISLHNYKIVGAEALVRWRRGTENFRVRSCTEGSDAREAKGRLITLDISLPHRGISGMTDLLRAAGVLITDRKVHIPELSVTSNLPSMMNGGKDFCEWSRKDREADCEHRYIFVPAASVSRRYSGDPGVA